MLLCCDWLYRRGLMRRISKAFCLQAAVLQMAIRNALRFEQAFVATATLRGSPSNRNLFMLVELDPEGVGKTTLRSATQSPSFASMCLRAPRARDCVSGAGA
jgi:hypothetical protein